MFDISNNSIITITRGDSASTTLFINLGTELHPQIFNIKNNPNAKVYLGVMEANSSFENALIKKKFTSDDFDDESHGLKIEFIPEDTEYLLPGVYYYSVKLVRPNPDNIGKNFVDTLISNKKFVIID